MELWDVYDENRQPLGLLHRRGDPAVPGEYYLGADVWVINSKGEILLTLRHPDKNDLPDEWENTAGSVLAGETSLEGAIRELREETGIAADPDEMVLFYTCRGENSFANSYLLRRDVNIEDLVFQEGETCGAMWVTFEKLEEMVAQPTGARPVASRWCTRRAKLYRLIRGAEAPKMR